MQTRAVDLSSLMLLLCHIEVVSPQLGLKAESLRSIDYLLEDCAHTIQLKYHGNPDTARP